MTVNRGRSARPFLLRMLIVIATILTIAVAIGVFGTLNGLWGRAFGFWAVVYYAKTGVEVIASIFAVFYILVALNYHRPAAVPQSDSAALGYPNVGLVYLCCDDLDEQALETAVAVCARYKARIWVHDDSASEESRCRVARTASALEVKYAQSIPVLRRESRVGGKPGALNNVVRCLPPDVEFLLICDSDTYLPGARFLESALGYFSDPRVALVQFRNVGQVFPDDSPEYKVLSMSIDFYDAFVSFLDRFGWSPFLGHAAMLRVATIREVEGFTPGQLADDIDYSVKLRLGGYKIRYAREITCGERHPATYEALRARTRKWAHGCTQVLLRSGWAILTSARLSALDKGTFFLTVAYYHFQVLLLGYLLLFYVVLPFEDHSTGGVLHLMLTAGLILFFTFVPSISYFVLNRKVMAWPRIAVHWGLTYGSQDFVILQAVLRCCLGANLKWIPTNGMTKRLGVIHYLPEVLFGLLIVVPAALENPPLLLLPTTILFAGKFLVAPVLGPLGFGRRSRGRASPRFPSLT